MEEFEKLNEEQLLNLVKRLYEEFEQKGERKIVASIQAEKC